MIAELAGVRASRCSSRVGKSAIIRRERSMRMKSALYLGVAAAGLTGWLALAPGQLQAQSTVAIDNDDIGGVVTGPNGPEAGVWVIAETKDLPTRFARMVVTDDQGRY